jgi:hypothetical protein
MKSKIVQSPQTTNGGQRLKVRSQKIAIKLLILLFIINYSLFTSNSYSQTGINTTGANPNSSSMLDVSSTNLGLLIPRMNSAQMNSIIPGANAESLLIFNAENNCFEAYINNTWYPVSCPTPCTASSAPIANAAIVQGCTSFIANWSPAAGATSYSLDISTDAGFSNFISGFHNLNMGNVTSFTVAGLTKNTSYYYRVHDCTGINSNSIMASTNITIPCVPITLTNNESSSTVSGFQQRITVNSSIYSSFESSGLQNIEFSTGQFGTGTVLQAWIESGASNSATSTVYWVNLGSTIIAANSSITVYMNFMPGNVMSASGPTGEAPQLSGTYGQYDNGANVFSFYDNFAGTSLNNSKWNLLGGSVTVNNGITLNTGLSVSFAMNEKLVNPATSYITYLYNVLNDNGESGNWLGILTGLGSYSTNGNGTWSAQRPLFYDQYRQGGSNNYGHLVILDGITASNSSSFTKNGVYNTYQVQTGSSVQKFILLNNPSVNVTQNDATTGGYWGIYASTEEGFMQWIFSSAFPPNGVMPGYVFGSVVSCL